MAPKAPLYTAEVLAMAVRLADYPLGPHLPLTGEARSRSCGSTLEIGLALDGSGRIAQAGCRARACAVGQAAAGLFLDGAVGRSADDLVQARGALAQWLAGEGPLPDWPGLTLLDPARAHPARHGATLLAWDAALAALASASPIR